MTTCYDGQSGRLSWPRTMAVTTLKSNHRDVDGVARIGAA
jgi:hypothetical protein